MIKQSTLFVLLFLSSFMFSQETKLNNYQYFIVANKFDFLKDANKYETSSLTKFLLKKKGFQVYLDNETYPKEIVNNRCLSLFVQVLDESSMFTTKNKIQFSDCYGKVVYTSGIGKSKSKVYKKAYQEAIRKAYATMDDFEYKYNSNILNEIKGEVIETTKEIISPAVIAKSQPNNKIVEKSININSDNILYAQIVDNGFQLVNIKPEVIFKVFKTNKNNVFIIDNKKGIFYKVGERWIAEYYVKGQLLKEEFQVKF